MAIQKRFIHFKKFSDFNSKKLSANEANTQYTVGISGAIQDGEPDILYQSYCWIKDTKQQWTHGQLYDGAVDLDGYATEQWVNEQGFLKEHQDISGKQDKLVDGVNIATINGQSLTAGGDITIEGGSLTESDIAAMGFTKNTGSYSKPSGGIPKSDLASAVQTSLGKADTALQSYTEQYKGTVTGVSANGTSVATSGVANIPAASTSKYGVTKLNSSTSSTSTTEAATPSAVKAAYDLANSYKGTVTSVKVDNVSKSPSSGAVDLGYVNKKLTTSTSSSMTLSPNIYYRNTSTSLSTLTITLGSVSNSNIINEYFVEFTTRSSGTTVSLPSTIKWANGETPTFEASTTYQISIVNNLGVVTKFK